MFHKPVIKNHPPFPESQTQRVAERDSLAETPEQRFLRDEIEALLGAATVRRTIHAPSIAYADDHAAIAPEDLGKEWLERATEAEPVAGSQAADDLESLSIDQIAELSEIDEGEEDTAVLSGVAYTRDTQPSVDVQMQRDAARLAGK